jgi:hypothetical protein
LHPANYSILDLICIIHSRAEKESIIGAHIKPPRIAQTLPRPTLFCVSVIAAKAAETTKKIAQFIL